MSGRNRPGGPACSRRHAGLGLQRGLTLIEALVALVILGLSLSALYGSLSGNLRAAHTVERQAVAVVLAQSLLDRYHGVPPAGIDRRGREANGMRWRVWSGPARNVGEDVRRLRLHELTVRIEGDNMAALEVRTLRPGVPEP